MDTFAQQLATHGFCVIPKILDEKTVQALRQNFSADMLLQTPDEQFGDAGGFVVADYRNPAMITLLTWPKTLQTLRAFGFNAPKLHNFYVSTKPPHATALAWHSDLFYHYDKPEPAELFLIYYLQDTAPANGCLRVVPGSHSWSHKKRHAQSEDAEPRPDEIDVPVHAGDLFIGDRRILHATHPNDSNSWRTCLTIAYAPSFESLPEPVQALIVRNRCLPPHGWWHENSEINPRLQKILPKYNGGASPVEF